MDSVAIPVIDFAKTGSIIDIVNVFRKASLISYNNLLPYAYQLLSAFLIIDLAITWSLYKGDFKIQELFERIAKVGFIMLLLKMMPEINGFMMRSFQQAGLIGAGISKPIDDFVTPSAILGKGIALVGVTKVGDKYTGILAEMEKISFWSDGGLTTWFVCAMTLVLVIFSFFMIAIELAMATIEFNIFASIAVILIPFAGLKFTSFLFQRCVSAVFQFGVKFLVIYFLVGLVWQIADKVSSITTRQANQPLDVAALLTYGLTYLTLGYLVMKIPTLVSGMLSGQPSISGNGVATSIGSNLMAAPMKAATTGAAVYGGTRAVLAAAKPAGGLNTGSIGKAANNLTALVHTSAYNMKMPTAKEFANAITASKVDGRYTTGNLGTFARRTASETANIALAKNPIGKAQLGGADSALEGMRKGRALRDGSYKTRTDEEIIHPIPNSSSNLTLKSPEVTNHVNKHSEKLFNNKPSQSLNSQFNKSKDD